MDLSAAVSGVIPCDLDAERGLLGWLLVDPQCSVTLPVEQFFDPRHRELYSLILAIQAEGRTVTPDAVALQIARAPLGRPVGGLEQLQRIVDGALQRSPDSATATATAAECAQRINEAWRRRQVIHKMACGMARAIDTTAPWEEVVGALDLSELTSGLPQRRFPLRTLCELDETAFEQRYLIPGVLAAGQAGGIYGPFKTLKTSCTADLLISIATGTEFLGHFPVAESGPVMLLSGEMSLAALQSLVRRICTARGLAPNSIQNFHFSTELPKLGDPADLVQLRSLITTHGLKVLAIDPAYLAIDLEEHGWNVFDMGTYLRQISRLCESTGCAVLLVHHCRRDTADCFRPATLSDIAWSGFAEFSAQWILLSRRCLFDPQSGENELWLSCGGRAGHASVWALNVDEGKADGGCERQWYATVNPPEFARARADERQQLVLDERRERRMAALLLRDRGRMLNLLREFPQGETANVLRDLLGFSGSRVSRVLTSLIESGVVEKVRGMEGRRGAPGFRVTRAWADPSNWATGAVELENLSSPDGPDGNP
jgi:hypothetical protein